MSDIASPSTVHADLRSASRSYKRDKNHITKWSFGPRPDVNGPILDTAWTPDTTTTVNSKTVPLKKHFGPSKSHANVSTKARGMTHYNIESANIRVTRKQDALREVTSPDSKSLSRSFADLLPSTATSIPIQRNEAADMDILYSFDKKASPSDKVGLGGLIEKAEQRFREKETVRLVKNEYEVLDGEGEREILRKGGKKERGVVGGGDVVVQTGMLDDEDDYELV